jgi:plastocyanin
VLVVGLVAVACSDRNEVPAGPTQGSEAEYTILVDAPYPIEAGLALTQYFPGAFSVHPGDRVIFDNQGLVNPHTVTFGAEADGSNLPRPILPDGVDNPAAVEPCFSPDPPNYEMAACPATAATPLAFTPYAGVGYWSSGVRDGAFTLELDRAIPTGTYPLFCTIHLGMGGSMTVVPEDATIPTPDDVLAEGLELQQAAVETGESETSVPEPTARVEDAFVVAGWGSSSVNVNRFEPATLEIRAGDTVTWTAETTYVHTVTFSDLIGGEVADSGYLSTLDGSAQAFRLTFPDPGTYGYVCVFHTPMTGTVEVR